MSAITINLTTEGLMASSENSNLARLSVELFDLVLSYIANKDIKCLRLTSRSIKDVAHLRLDRVFLSPHPRDVQVFQSIARHETYRKQVFEIIYDDARFSYGLPSGRWWVRSIWPLTPAMEEEWFLKEHEVLEQQFSGFQDYSGRRPDNLERSAKFRARISAEHSFAQYMTILEEQELGVKSGADADALREGLARFPRLRRITLTPAAHGDRLNPLYETPMIRSLPAGFICPSPRGWPTRVSYNDHLVVMNWGVKQTKDNWRGFCLITRVLAEYIEQNLGAPCRIKEFVIDTNSLMTGLNCRIFDPPRRPGYEINRELRDLHILLRQPGFSRLDLALMLCGEGGEKWAVGHGAPLRQTLSQAVDLQHVSLTTNADSPDILFDTTPEEQNSKYFVPLRTIFPLQSWANLRHFGLCRFTVKQSDLLALLAAMPDTLRSVELSFLYFLQLEGSYREFFEDIRSRLGWRERHVRERSCIAVAVESMTRDFGSIAVHVDREINAFVYGEGENPFGAVGVHRNQVFPGIGIERDAFEPAHELYTYHHSVGRHNLIRRF
ncbi:hypothetical protein F5X68DRAFT_191402 [Plectosphaerella plurivora]|uniref:F-box domain-containing protein n=1 Tax=Plectosphaerella plurivora TaxID=936078 RepID=A0A9P8VC58_9PEZI|nr:hypothetical protein F5X68DRAFT_191402 [Plectosphaerella plurivora]